MMACVEAVLGIKPSPEELTLSHFIPSHWKRAVIDKTFRGKEIRITIEIRPGSKEETGTLYLNGEVLEGSFIPEEQLKEVNSVRYIL